MYFFSKNDYLELKLINMMINMHLNDKYMILGFDIVKYVFFYLKMIIWS